MSRPPTIRDGLAATERGEDEVDGDLFLHGSGEFAYTLATKGLIDEYEI